MLPSTFSRKKVHPGNLAGGFSDLEMTWLLYCAGAATVHKVITKVRHIFVIKNW